jgi:hypothetical protein
MEGLTITQSSKRKHLLSHYFATIIAPFLFLPSSTANADLKGIV